MQARRYTSSSLQPPSSPPFAPQYFGEASSPPEAREPASPTWTAPSPTRTLGHSSPELPLLPSFSVLGNGPRTPSTAARRDRTDTSYYTASWGSPYRHPPPTFDPSRVVSANFGSDDFDEESSGLQFGLGHLLPSRLDLEEDSPNRFNLDHLIPRLDQDASPIQFSLEHLIRSRLPTLETQTPESRPSGATPRPSDQNPTSAEWVQKFLEERWNRETNDWRSNDSDTEGSAGEQSVPIAAPPKRGHRDRNTNKTLNQQDFWRHFSKDQKEALGKMMASKYADPESMAQPRSASGTSVTQKTNGLSPTADKTPIPTPIKSPKLSEETPSKTVNAGAFKANQEIMNKPLPDPPAKSLLAPPGAAPAQVPRTRKKVMVKGKGCIISIPRDIPRGSPGFPPKPMSAEDVDNKLRQLEQQGYDTRGFSTGGLETHNRAIWPSEADVQAERTNAASQYKVRVSKLSEWKDYENSLLEAKLAALGVSMGGEEDIALPLSRTASSHPGQVFSPPLPTSSAGSLRMNRQGSIAGFPFGPSPGHMSRQSIASPAAFGNPRTSMHMHRHSTFGSPANLNFPQHGYSPSGTWSPSGYFNSQDGRSGSPAHPLSRPDLAGLISPISPFGMRPNQQFPITPQRDDFQLHIQLQQQQLQAQLLQQQQHQQQQQQQVLGLRPASTLAEVPEDEDEVDEVPAMKHATKSTTEIVVPTPRNHRHNLSENLEREAANEEYHLEEAIDKQFAEGGDFSTEPETNAPFKPSNAVAKPTWEDSRTVLHQPQPHSRAHSLAKSQKPVSFSFPAQAQQNPRTESDGARTNISENTNPSLEDGEVHTTQHSKAPSQVSNSWKDNKFAFGKPTSAMHSKHTSRSSVSKLNVEAKEFKFNPSASFSPGSFSSGFSSFAPAVKPPTESVAPSNAQPTIDGLATFNVTAPTFKPDATAFKPDVPASKPVAAVPAVNASMNSSSFPTGGFDFSSPPAFKPDAPVFNPGVSAFNPNKPVPAPTTFSSKIFGDVNLSAIDIVKPATRSKAVPIVRPDNTRQKTPEAGEDREDEAGRPMQADGREKRARRDRADGDDVPKFAIQPVLQSQPLAQFKEPNISKLDFEIEREELDTDKENLSPEFKRPTKTQSKSPEPLSRSTAPFEPISPAPFSPAPGSDAAADDDTPHASDVLTPTTEEPVPGSNTHGHKSTLSANAKPFEFRPQFSSAGYDFGFHVTKPSQVEDPEKAQVSPPRSRFASRSPATTYRPSDDGSFKTAMESGRHAARYTESESADFDNVGDASFNDIDAVMKHMDGEGSDFGVERDETSWDQSSPQRTPHVFERSDLQPSFKLRSDAPSPSPRRGFFPGRVIPPGSATSVQDPFDSERAALPYESPVRHLNGVVDEGPISDWDTEDEIKVQARSGFFDKHVDDLMGRLLQDRLGPLEQNLQGIQETLASISQRPGRGRRSMSTNERLDSDADDEDDDAGIDHVDYRTRSRGRDRKLEKIRSIVRDALETHQSQITSLPVPVPEPMVPEKIREIVTDALAQHLPPVQPVEPDEIRVIIQNAIAANKPESQHVSDVLKPEDIRSILADMLAAHVPQPVEQVKPDDIRSIVMEAFETHAPQPVPAPVPEQIWPEDLKSIFAEVLASQQPSAPAAPTAEPDLIRSMVSDALASQRPKNALEAPVDIPQPTLDMTELYQIIGSLKASIAQTTSHHLHADDVRELIDDAFKRQNTEVAERKESQAVEERDVRIADLEEMLKEATLRFDSESEARKAIEAREADSARLLKVTEEELTLLQQAARDDEHKINALTEERNVIRHSLTTYQANEEELRDRVSSLTSENEQLKLTNIALESSEEDLKKKLDSVTAENEALTFTLEEHRLSANKWRGDLQQAHEEGEQLRKAIGESRFQAEEATRVRESMRAKFEKLQQDMVIATQQIAAERSQWQKAEETSASRYEILSARIEAEGRTRERLETELERLETQEREGMKLRFNLEQTRKHNVRLEETIDQLRQESMQHQKNAERYERDMREARDAAHVEIRRTRVLMEADVDAANNQVNIVRHELESEIARVRAELDQVRLDADTTKEKHELDLEAASDLKKQALQDALESKRHSLHEQQRTFERQLEHIKHEHARALEFAREDRERAESFHNDKLALADSKLDHFKDKIALLEEKLQVAKEAATAAVAAASKSPMSSTFGPSGSDKISTQALRESIGVLQEQLQEREGRIEALERQLEDVDTEAPAKLKERDTEINWLRELLGVRVDDLNDLINSLAQPTFDRETVRDAAIRIRTNLQMEQSEKERLISGGQQSFPTLSSLSNFASPKAVQLAAAIGNWRKGRGEATSALAGNNTDKARNVTPARAQPHSAQSFLSGLMTPPTSNMRRSSELSASSSRPQVHRVNSNSSRVSTEAGFPSLGKAPRTPPLMRKQAYDQDAEMEHFSESGFYDDESTSTVDDGQLTPLALNFGRELSHR